MSLVTYYKIGNRWFLDLPDYLDQGGDPDDLERIGYFHDFLEMAAAGESTIVFQIDAQPFEGCDSCELIGSSGGKTGGYYHLKNFEGQAVDYELWFNTVLYFTHSELPEKVYFKRMRLTSTN